MKQNDSKMHVWLDMPTSKVLRELAQVLGIYMTRGAGAKRDGNVAGLFRAVATAWQNAPEAVMALLHMIRLLAERKNLDVFSWTSEACGHSWLMFSRVVPSECPLCGERHGPIHAVIDERRLQEGQLRRYEGENPWVVSANAILEEKAQRRQQAGGSK